MANTKNTTKKSNTKKGSTKKANSKKKTSTKKKSNSKKQVNFYEDNKNAISLSYIGASLLLLCFTFIPGYNVWATIRGSFFAFFGFGFIILNFSLLIIGIRIALDNLKKGVVLTTFSAFIVSVLISSIVHLSLNSVVAGGTEEWLSQLQDASAIGYYISDTGFKLTGGILGALLGGGMLHTCGNIAAFILCGVLLFIFMILFLNIKFSAVGSIVTRFINFIKEKLFSLFEAISNKRTERKKINEEKKNDKFREPPIDKNSEKGSKNKNKKDSDEETASSDYNDDSNLGSYNDFDFNSSDIDNDFSSYTQDNENIDDENSDVTDNKNENEIFSTEMSDLEVAEAALDEEEKAIPETKEDIILDPPTFSNRKGRDRTKQRHVPSNSIFTKYKPNSESDESANTPSDPDNSSMAEEESASAEKVSSNFENQPEEKSKIASESGLTDDAKKIVEDAAENADKIRKHNRAEVESYVPKKEYTFPPIECLREPDFSRENDYASEMKLTAKKLVDTLKSFGVETTLIGVSRGPSVTRYELQPAPGVKISKITNLADDIALNLASSGVRIEAPIPDKSAVGIEVPNRLRATVTLREVISASEFKNSKSKLNVALGKDITGGITCADLSKMPHLLIAGTTGSGKSVCLNCMIVSILYNAKPTEVKLIMIDPKQVEFSVYNGIPHLMVPVISDVRKAAASLAWAVSEMEKRYKAFSTCGVRDISGFNRYVKTHPEYEFMPQIVIFIDELNDLMMVSPKEVEDYICRLAQKARAAGMHLVVATQRPSVDVITGIIKANIPSRISLSVSSQVDSRTILDSIGAEKLLGNGDMLFNRTGVYKPVRIQGAYLSDEEIEKIVTYIKSQADVEYNNDVMSEIEKNATMDKKQTAASAGDSVDDGTDDMLLRAMDIGSECEVISVSLLQRKLRIGYARAARIVDELDEMGLVGPAEGGGKPRKFLMTRAQYLERISSASSGSNGNGDDDGGADDFDIFSD